MDNSETSNISGHRVQQENESQLIPARIINEYTYCPRLAYLEWVQGEWAESFDTVEGAHAHRRVDQERGSIPAADDVTDEDEMHARSVTLSSDSMGVVAKMDLIEVENGVVTPIDYKKGKRPHVAKGAYDPERVQLCVQGLILREHGYQCHEGALYFVASKERVPVVFDEELIGITKSSIEGMRNTAANGDMPSPLEDSPKCPRCSLVGICLPDEVNFLKHHDTKPRPLVVGGDHTRPVYIQHHSARVRKKGNVLHIEVDDQQVSTARLAEISQVVAMGNIYITTPALHELMRREIPVSWYSYGGWFLGHTVGVGHKNVELRTAQYQKSFDSDACLRLAQTFVRAKILNSRTLLRRNWRGGSRPQVLMRDMKMDADNAGSASSLSELLGIEGAAAARYFANFKQLLKADDGFDFDFSGRNRRPPKDAVNALLSYAYALLVRTWSNTLTAVGFDVYRGFFHQPRYGRPALALDMMESFRSLIADSSVLQAINNGEVKPNEFVTSGASVALKPDARKRFIATFERRLSHEITHPIFGYKASYRRIMEIQARLLARHLLGEISDYPEFITR